MGAINNKNPELLLKEQALQRIDFLLSKKIVTEEELYYFVKEFFKQYLHLDYEFTYEELEEELNKIFIDEETREMLDKFLEEVSFIEFSDIKLSDKEIKDLLKTFALIIDMIIHEELPKDSEARRLIESLRKNNKKEEKLIENGEEKSSMELFNEELDKAIREMANDVEKAKEYYLKALSIYNELLPLKDKKKVYPKLKELYESLKNQ